MIYYDRIKVYCRQSFPNGKISAKEACAIALSAKACGVVCEYNPFHNGHAYQLKQIREILHLPVVCAMSGTFVQRAEPACMPKAARAACAAKHGASLVLELPFPYSCFTAEKFAEAGVRLLDQSGLCSHLAFGSECADSGLLSALAEALCDKALLKSIQVYQKEHPELTYIRARSAVLRTHFGEAAARCENPNDILGIEYIKAIRKCGADLIPIALARSVGRNDAPNGVFASSSLVRRLAAEGDLERAEAFLPDDAAHGFLKSYQPETFRKTVYLLLLSKTQARLSECCEYGGGLENAVYRAVHASHSYEEAFDALKCKTLTDAKIRRLFLFGAFDVTKEQAETLLAYANVLACAKEEAASALLREARKNSLLPLARRVGTIRKNKNAAAQYAADALAEQLLYAGGWPDIPIQNNR